MIKESKQWVESVIKIFVFLFFIPFVVRLPQIFTNGVRQSIRFGAQLWQTVVHAVPLCVGSVWNVVLCVSTRIKKTGVMRLVRSVV
ncbi:MAG: hypothetical protein KDA77_20960, partial [Planctomycetaceae bacterium]|nr:hypothetical protein [Planctomycetaceae bacterium]